MCRHLNYLLAQIRAILHDLKCIGVIHRQGKDAAGQPLQEEYYYMPDEDRERTTLVSNIKGWGLRSRKLISNTIGKTTSKK